jgi:hypothetical protein
LFSFAAAANAASTSPLYQAIPASSDIGLDAAVCEGVAASALHVRAPGRIAPAASVEASINLQSLVFIVGCQ